MLARRFFSVPCERALRTVLEGIGPTSGHALSEPSTSSDIPAKLDDGATTGHGSLTRVGRRLAFEGRGERSTTLVYPAQAFGGGGADLSSV